MLTGELPLGRFAPPSQKVQIDVRLDEVVLRALEKEPERRYQHASDVKTDVESLAGVLSAPKGKAAPGNPSSAAVASGDAGQLEQLVLSFLPEEKIAAIKAYRERTGAGLKEAKEAVEAIASKHGISFPPVPPRSTVEVAGHAPRHRSGAVHLPEPERSGHLPSGFLARCYATRGNVMAVSRHRPRSPGSFLYGSDSLVHGWRTGTELVRQPGTRLELAVCPDWGNSGSIRCGIPEDTLLSSSYWGWFSGHSGCWTSSARLPAGRLTTAARKDPSRRGGSVLPNPPRSGRCSSAFWVWGSGSCPGRGIATMALRLVALTPLPPSGSRTPRTPSPCHSGTV